MPLTIVMTAIHPISNAAMWLPAPHITAAPRRGLQGKNGRTPRTSDKIM